MNYAEREIVNMIRIYTSSEKLDVDGSHCLNRSVIEVSNDPTHVISFPECSYDVPTHPYELMSSFKSYVYNMLQSNQDLWVITYSSLVFDIIRLCAKQLNSNDAIQLYDFKDGKFVVVTCIDDKGRMYGTALGIFNL